MAIDFQGLLAVGTATEAEEFFSMRYWESPNSCGTTHCLVGAFCVAHKCDSLQLDRSKYLVFARPRLGKLTYLAAIAVRFGITEKEASWLFAGTPGASAAVRWAWTPATRLTKDAALARLRKFIYYKLHKQEMVVESGRNKQLHQPRNISGRRSVVVAQHA